MAGARSGRLVHRVTVERLLGLTVCFSALGGVGVRSPASVPRLRRAATLPSLVMLTFLVLLSPQLSNTAFLQIQGIVFVLAATALVLGVAVANRPDGLAERFLSWAPFRLSA